MAPTKSQIVAYIRQAAVARGIDPSTAVRVARAEGLNANPADGWQSNVVKNGRRETSYGPFQLRVGGGLGDAFIRATGKSPKDPSTVFQQIDFALDQAARGGWGPWYGAKAAGLGNRAGLADAKPIGIQTGTAVASATPPNPIPRPSPFDPAQLAASMQSLGVTPYRAPPPQPSRMAGLDRFNDPALGFAPRESAPPSVQAVNAQAQGVSPPVTGVPQPPRLAASQFPPSSVPVDQFRQQAQRALRDAQTNPPRPNDYFGMDDMRTLQPEFPVGGRPSYADQSLPQPNQTVNRQRAAPRAGTMQPRSVPTQTIRPSEPYADDVTRAMDRPSGSGFPAFVSGAQAAPMPPPPATVGRPANMTAQAFDERFNAQPDVGAGFRELTGRALPSMSQFTGGIPTAPMAQQMPAAPRLPAGEMARRTVPIAAGPNAAYRTAPLQNPNRTRLPTPRVTPQQARQVAERIVSNPSMMSRLFGGGTLPTMAGPGTSPQNTYTPPSGNASYDVTPGSHGSYNVSPGGTIMSPSEALDAMRVGGGWWD